MEKASPFAIVIKFNGPIDVSTLDIGLSNNFEYTDVPIIVSYDSTTFTATFTPVSNLEYGTSYGFYVYKIKDSNGILVYEAYDSSAFFNLVSSLR